MGKGSRLVVSLASILKIIMTNIITIGDAMRDIFIFPALDDMEKLANKSQVQPIREHFEKYMVFGLGDKVTISDAQYSIGGSAANVATGLKKLGFHTSIITAIGEDPAGVDVKSVLSKAGISTSNIKIYKNKKTGFSVIVSYKGERTIFVYHAFEPTSFVLPGDLNADWFYLGPMAQGFEKLYNQVTAEVIKRNIKVAINPGSRQISAGLNSFGGLLKLIEIIFLNKEEAQAITGLKGVPQVKDLAKTIHAQGAKIVVITDGQKGAYAYNGEDFNRVGIYPATRIDATGAGDSFASAFLAGIIEEESLIECLKWGVTNSASVVEKVGTQDGLLSKGTIKKRVKEYRWPAESLRFS